VNRVFVCKTSMAMSYSTMTLDVKLLYPLYACMIDWCWIKVKGVCVLSAHVPKP
jgi:hypothetical protein